MHTRRQALSAKLASLSDDALRAADAATLARSYGVDATEVSRRVADAIKGEGAVMQVTFPWPSSELAGHANGHWRTKHEPTKVHKAAAFALTKSAMAGRSAAPPMGDIPITFTFMPPHNRGDRVNYPNMLKPYIDGIAAALGVNDRRFLPSYVFLEACAPGAVLVTVEGV